MRTVDKNTKTRPEHFDALPVSSALGQTFRWQIGRSMVLLGLVDMPRCATATDKTLKVNHGRRWLAKDSCARSPSFLEGPLRKTHTSLHTLCFASTFSNTASCRSVPLNARRPPLHARHENTKTRYFRPWAAQAQAVGTLSARFLRAFDADWLTAVVVKRAYLCLPFLTLHVERTPVQPYQMVAPPGRASQDPLSSMRQRPSDRHPSNPPPVILPSTLSLPTAWLAYLRLGLLPPLRYKKMDRHDSGETR